MKLLQLALVLVGAVLVGISSLVASGLPREAGMALCVIATVWAALLGVVALAIGGIRLEP
jgi:hypothetical protein